MTQSILGAGDESATAPYPYVALYARHLILSSGRPSANSMTTDDKQFTHDNHYVPQSYLKNWVGSGNTLWASRLLVSHPRVPIWREVLPKGVAKHQHLYTRTLAYGESDEMEDWLNKEFETPAQDSIRRVLSNEPLAPGDTEKLVRYLAAQDARTPARMIESIERLKRSLPGILDEVLEEVVAELKEAKRTGIPPSFGGTLDADIIPVAVVQNLQPGETEGTLQIQTIAGRDMWLFSLRRLLTETLNILLQHEWTVLRSPAQVKWLTSDNPVVKIRPLGKNGCDLAGGWAAKETQIFMPLGPNHLLYAEVGESPPPHGTVLSLDVATTVQRRIVENGYRYIFGIEPNEQVQSWRPRHVSREAFVHETEQWAQWPQSQTDAARALLMTKDGYSK